MNHYCGLWYGTNRQQGKCMLRVRVTFACKRVALFSTARERVCFDILTHTFVFYHTSTYYTVTTYYLQELTYMDCRLQSQATTEKRGLKIHSDDDSKYIVTDDSQFSGWWGNGNSQNEDLKVLYIPTYLTQIYYSHVIRIVAKPAVLTVKL